MPNVTIRDIPEDVLNKIKILSQTKRRSMNNEILLIIENGLKHYTCGNANTYDNTISKDVQLSIWSNLSGKWEDTRETDKIIDDIYENRTKGRNIEL
jgi:plasmid stability protein